MSKQTVLQKIESIGLIPVVRVASIDTPVPYSPPLEDYYLPQVKDVVEAARKLAAY